MAATKTVDPNVPEIEDFSAVLQVAVTEYLERHHPGLIEKTALEIREAFFDQKPLAVLKVAEGKPAKPDLTIQHVGEALRRARAQAEARGKPRPNPSKRK